MPTPSQIALDAARQRTNAALQAETGAPLGPVTTIDDGWQDYWSDWPLGISPAQAERDRKRCRELLPEMGA